MTNQTAYPLSWPQGQKRTPSHLRQGAVFGVMKPSGSGSYSTRHKITLGKATTRLDNELGRMGISSGNYVLSTNVPLRKDGWPYSSYAPFDDVGVAVYFQIEGVHVSPCCDKWDRVEDNIVAIAKHIESLRGQERWGVATLKQAFAGHMALPAPMTGIEPWYSTLSISPEATRDEINSRYRSMAKQHHSDNGGNDVDMAALNVARDQALQEVRRMK